MRSSLWLTQLAPRLTKQINFVMEVDRLKAVLRGSRLADGTRHENTAEHSWHLTICALALKEYAVAPIAIDRVVQMLIVHDIVEIDSGDTSLFDGDYAQTQKEREQHAADRIFGLLPDDQNEELRALWEELSLIHI